MRARHMLIAISSGGLICSAGLAQIAPPPPPPTTPEPAFEPPPIPPPRPATPPRPQQMNPQLTDQLPDLPHPPLWQFCGTENPEVDEVCRFEDNLHFVALRPNPTISPGMVPMIQEVIVARRWRFEGIVIENLGVTMDVDGGLIQSVTISDPTTLAELLEQVKPLTPPSNLTQELQNRGVLTAVQARFNNKIIGDYQRMYGTYLKRAYPQDSTDRFMRSMFEDSMIEAMQAYEGLLHESRLNIEQVVDQVKGIPSEARADLLALKIDTLDGTPDQRRESAEAVKMAWRPLSLEQKQAFLRAVRSLRPNEMIPPVPTINVTWAGKRIIEDKPVPRLIRPNQTGQGTD